MANGCCGKHKPNTNSKLVPQQGKVLMVTAEDNKNAIHRRLNSIMSPDQHKKLERLIEVLLDAKASLCLFAPVRESIDYMFFLLPITLRVCRTSSA